MSTNTSAAPRTWKTPTRKDAVREYWTKALDSRRNTRSPYEQTDLLFEKDNKPAKAVAAKKEMKLARPLLTSVRSARPDGFAAGTPGRQVGVFLDRDGVILDLGLPTHPEDVKKHLLPGSLAAIKRLATNTGWPIILASNQGGIDRGVVSDADTRAVMEELARLIQEAGGRIDAIYYSPNGEGYVPPEGEVSGRKPEPGMLFQAARDFGERIDLADSYFVGDRATDMFAGKAAHPDLTTILVRTGWGGRDLGSPPSPDREAADLSEAVEWILAREAGCECPKDPSLDLVLNPEFIIGPGGSCRC